MLYGYEIKCAFKYNIIARVIIGNINFRGFEMLWSLRNVDGYCKNENAFKTPGDSYIKLCVDFILKSVHAHKSFQICKTVCTR